jgi:hypothetical protein
MFILSYLPFLFLWRVLGAVGVPAVLIAPWRLMTPGCIAPRHIYFYR